MGRAKRAAAKKTEPTGMDNDANKVTAANVTMISKGVNGRFLLIYVCCQMRSKRKRKHALRVPTIAVQTDQ